MLAKSSGVAAVLALVLAAAPPASADRYVAGDPGAGDPFFPLAGHGGYDVRHYSLDLRYARESNRLSGRVAVFARATQDLWFPAPAALPGPEALFGTPVYFRGAMTLQALRQKLGDATFFRILRAWYRVYEEGKPQAW